MHLLKLLAILGRGDQTSSEGMYEVLVDVMRRADTGINVGYALVYQAVHTVTSIYPNPILLDAAATSISRFIRSDSHNLKYIGIKGLATIVKDHPKYAADHQMAVIDCLEDPDETLKRKTLDLLFRMTNSVNVEFIVEKLLSFLALATDDHFRTDLVGQITQCAERFAPSNAWYVQTMVKVFECAGDKVKLSVAQTLVQLIAEGQDDPEEGEEEDMNSDDELRMEAVEDFLDLIDKAKLPEILAQAMAWILGEYGYLSESCSKEQIMEKLCNLAYRTVDFNTRGHVITAVMKLVAQNGSCPLRVTKMITHFSISSSLDVQQRCLEFKELLIASECMADALPVDASCEDIDIDEDLSFLNEYVQSSLNKGAKSYCLPESMKGEEDIQIEDKSLNITPYSMPSVPTVLASNIMSGLGGSTPTGPTHIASSSTTPQATVAAVATQGNQLLNTRGVAAVWGPKAVVPEPVVVPKPPTPPLETNVPSTIEVSSPTVVVASVVTKEITPPEQEKPRELSEREKMAASLFGGVSSTKTSTRRSSTKLAPSPAPVVPVIKEESLLETSPVPAPQVNTSSKVSNDLDIFADMNDMVTSPTTNNNNNNLNDIFADMSVGAVPIQQQQHTNSQPLALTTSEFGQKWGVTPCEMKQFSLSKKITNLEQLRRGMPLNLSHVESIQNSGEAIFAAKSITGTVILIHIKLALQKQGCDITVKATSKDLCLAEIESISKKISTF
jgi:AP-4 complex subunit epsilon-1